MRRPLVLAAIVAAVAIGAVIGIIAASTPGPGASASPVAVASPTPTPTPIASLPAPTPSATPTPSPSPTPSPTPTPTTVAAPLTGLPVSPAAARRHPIAVMIDDLSPARPQSGLSEASVVWHAPAEGGIPRYMAIFQDTLPEQIGPVRSARLYYIAWAAEWKAVYAHAGGSPQAKEILGRRGNGKSVFNAEVFRWEGRFFHRVTFRFAPHNVYTSGRELRRLGNRLGAEDGDYRSVWQFAPDAPEAERPSGGSIVVRYPYNRVSYQYHRASNTWRRSVSVEGKQVDAGTKERIAPKNVVVVFMRFGPLNDGSPKHRLEADYVGKGKAWIFTNGRRIRGTWEKEGLNRPTRFFDNDGNPVTLTAGQTFVQVVPTGTTIGWEPGTDPEPAESPDPSASPGG